MARYLKKRNEILRGGQVSRDEPGRENSIFTRHTSPDPGPATYPEEDRAYYIEVHGFDPVEDRVWIDKKHDEYCYQQEFPLRNDPLLHAVGVTIIARVEVHAGKCRNRMVFRRDKKKAIVPCIHTAVCTLHASEAFHALSTNNVPGVIEWARTTERKAVHLSPEEHFASLKSYVQGIAELGIMNMMTASYESEEVNPTTLPFGFNSAMQRQVIRALRRLVPKVMRGLLQDFLVELFDNVPREWLMPRLELLNRIYSLREIITVDSPLFELLPVPSRGTSGFKLKILLCGEDEHRKREIIDQMLISRFAADYKRTVGVDVLTKNVEYQEGDSATLSIWDISSSTRFNFIRRTFYRGAAGAILMLDVSDATAWRNIKKWLEEIVNVVGTIPFLLIGYVGGDEEAETTRRSRKVTEYVRRRGGIYIQLPAEPDTATRLRETTRDMTRFIIAQRT